MRFAVAGPGRHTRRGTASPGGNHDRRQPTFEKRNQELKAQYRKALADGVIDESEREELERLRREYGLTVEEADEIRKRAFASRGARCPHCGEPLESEGGQGPAGS